MPPALVFGHPGFLRAVPRRSSRPAASSCISWRSTSRAAPDGRWWVVGTRTQAPSGAGYALENRAIISRLFPDAFRELRVQRAGAVLPRRCGRRCSPARRPTATSPHVVLLTPGPYNETYFEHAYLARYLGFPLVEGGDLTVRDDRVFLKTVSGLRPVHAILRRLDDDFCDPLELRADSTLGVPGLVQAWRAGHVLVANAFGIGRARIAGAAGVPAARSASGCSARRSRLPSVATWWCGEAAALDDARRHVSRRRHQAGVSRRVDGARVRCRISTPTGAREWAERLGSRARTRYVVEEFLPLSHAPVWHDGRLESRALMLRVFLRRRRPRRLPRDAGRAVAHRRRGAPCRVGAARRQQQGHVGALRCAGGSAWRCFQGGADRRCRARGERMTSSRAAEHLFWLGRYAERSENCARLLRAVLARLTDGDGFAAGLAVPAFRIAQAQGLLGPDARLAPPDVARATKSPAPVDIVRTSAHAGTRARSTGCSTPDSRSLAFNCRARSASPARCAIACRPTTGACSIAC